MRGQLVSRWTDAGPDLSVPPAELPLVVKVKEIGRVLTTSVAAHDARARGVAVPEPVAAGRHQGLVTARRAVLQFDRFLEARRLAPCRLGAGLNILLIEQTQERHSSAHLEVVVNVATSPGQVVASVAEASERRVIVQRDQGLHVSVD